MVFDQIAKETAAHDQVHGDEPASVAEVAFARYSYFKYLHSEDVAMGNENSFFDASKYEDPTSVPQHDGKITYLKSTMEKNPSHNNVYGLIEELEDRKHLD